MIDWNFEDRLVNRIALREAARRQLTSRQRCILRQHALGHTLKEIGEYEGISSARAHQIERRAIEKLQSARAGLVLPKMPRQTIKHAPPSFDKAAFLEHMRLLIQERKRKALFELAIEERELSGWLRRERRQKTQLSPSPSPPPKPENYGPISIGFCPIKSITPFQPVKPKPSLSYIQSSSCADLIAWTVPLMAMTLGGVDRMESYYQFALRELLLKAQALLATPLNGIDRARIIWAIKRWETEVNATSSA